jgi:hypothetical protein
MMAGATTLTATGITARQRIATSSNINTIESSRITIKRSSKRTFGVIKGAKMYTYLTWMGVVVGTGIVGNIIAFRCKTAKGIIAVVATMVVVIIAGIIPLGV